MSRRRVHRTPDLTSLLDVLFILIFASLIRTAALQNAEAEPPPPAAKPVIATPPPPPADIAELRTRALANLDKQLATRKPLVIRVSSQGVIVAVEADTRKLPLDVPLLEHSPDPDIGVAYLGERSAELRVCRVAASSLRPPRRSPIFPTRCTRAFTAISIAASPISAASPPSSIPPPSPHHDLTR